MGLVLIFFCMYNSNTILHLWEELSQKESYSTLGIEAINLIQERRGWLHFLEPITFHWHQCTFEGTEMRK